MTEPLWELTQFIWWIAKFLLLARYVPNVAKRSIWHQCKKKYILRTDRPTDQPVIWENFKWLYLQKGSSDPLHVWFYGGVFGVGGSNGDISGLTKFNRYVGKTMLEEWLEWSQSKVFLVTYILSHAYHRMSGGDICGWELEQRFNEDGTLGTAVCRVTVREDCIAARLLALHMRTDGKRISVLVVCSHN